MKRLSILAGLSIVLNATGCSTRVSVEHEQTAESGERSTTIVEVAPLDSSPSVPSEPPADLQPPVIDLVGTGHAIVFGDLEEHHHLHVHKAAEPPSVRVDLRVEVEIIDDRDRRRLVEQRITELLDRR